MRIPLPHLPFPIGQRSTRLVLLVALSLSLLAGCDSAAAPTGVLRLPIYGSLGNPDPAFATSPQDMLVASLLYSGLLKYGPDLHVVPELAVSLPTISAGGRVYTFTVRQDCRFADGTRCTAADVAFSLARPLLPPVHSAMGWKCLHDIVGARAVWRGRSASLAGVRVLDALTLRIRLIAPDADFLQQLAFPVDSVVERKVLRGARIKSWWGHSAGTGPFRMIGRTRSGYILAPRRHFYGGPVQVRQVDLLPQRSPADSLTLFHKGSLDAAEVPPERLDGFAGDASFHRNPGLITYYALPDRPAPALAADLNDAALVAQAGNALNPLSAIVPPAVPDYVSSPASATPAPQSTPGVRITSDPHDPVAASLRHSLLRQWHGHGGTISVRLVRVSHLLPDPGLWLRVALPQTPSTWYRHLLRRAMTLTNDPVTRMSTYSRLEFWALQNGYVIPIAYTSNGYLINPTVQNLQVTPLGLMPANNSWSTVTVS